MVYRCIVYEGRVHEGRVHRCIVYEGRVHEGGIYA